MSKVEETEVAVTLVPALPAFSKEQET